MRTLRATQIAGQFAVSDDTPQIAEILAALVILARFIIGTARLVNGITLWASDIKRETKFTLTVFGIGIRSLAWGLGL